MFAVNHNERRHATWRRRGPDFLLAGLVVTERGERLQPSFTTKGSTGQHVRAQGAALTETEVVPAMLHNFAGVWQALYPAEQQRIARLLIASVVVSEQAVSIVWRDAGWLDLARELRPDGIGAELLELEAEGAAV